MYEAVGISSWFLMLCVSGVERTQNKSKNLLCGSESTGCGKAAGVFVASFYNTVTVSAYLIFSVHGSCITWRDHSGKRAAVMTESRTSGVSV